MTTATHTPDGIPLTPDVPEPLTTPPGVPDDRTIWVGDKPDEDEDDRLSYAMFSGGDDSLVATHRAMSEGEADAVLYLNTNSGLAENLEYVIETCRAFGWPLRIESTTVSLCELAMKYGFFGSAYHNVAYSYLKERQLTRIAGEMGGIPTFITGVYANESDRRMRNLSDVGAVQMGKEDRWVWKQPLVNDTAEAIDAYRREHDLPENPIKKSIHRSGDCYCAAFAHRDELLVDLRAGGFDRHANWLLAVEAAVQAYRGRLAILEEEYTHAWARVDRKRDEYNIKPMRLAVLRELYPDVADYIDDVSNRRAIERGREDGRNYWGHGDMTSKELQDLVAKHDDNQMSLCAACGMDTLEK